jgi:DNA-binding MarR family transcriptional regulator
MEVDGVLRRVPYPGDRRRQLIEITTQGRALQKRMWPVYASAIERHVGCKITENEAEALADTLAKLRLPLPPA